MSLLAAVSCIYNKLVAHVRIIQPWYIDLLVEAPPIADASLEQKAAFVLSCVASYRPPPDYSEIQILRHIRDLSYVTKMASELAHEIKYSTPVWHFNVTVADIKECKSLPSLDLADLGDDHLLGQFR